jgi:ABC-type multidrug transport system fused ATPase/permease subunit
MLMMVTAMTVVVVVMIMMMMMMMMMIIMMFLLLLTTIEKTNWEWELFAANAEGTIGAGAVDCAQSKELCDKYADDYADGEQIIIIIIILIITITIIIIIIIILLLLLIIIMHKGRCYHTTLDDDSTSAQVSRSRSSRTAERARTKHRYTNRRPDYNQS